MSEMLANLEAAKQEDVKSNLEVNSLGVSKIFYVHIFGYDLWKSKLHVQKKKGKSQATEI